MTVKPLTAPFALRSEGTVRPPHTITTEEERLDLRAEFDTRAELYPTWVKKGTMTREEADHELTVWRAILDDYIRLGGQPRAPSAVTWEAKVRALRRELALRRNAYPRWIASPTNPLDAETARRRLEVLDAVHWRYWLLLFGFSGPGVARATDLARHAHAALMHREVEGEGWAAAIDARDAGSDAAHAERVGWHRMEKLARGLAAGGAWHEIVSRAQLRDLADRASAALAAAFDGYWRDRATEWRVAQLHPLEDWITGLDIRITGGRPTAPDAVSEAA